MNPIRQSIDLLTRPDQIIEIRTISDHIASGYFNQPGELARVAEILDSPDVQGVYITLNPVRPELFSRRANRVKSRLSRSDATTSDADILCRSWLPIDIDPIRPSGISSSDAEHTASLQRAEEMAVFLKGIGFPDPIVADSGNGAHLLYAIDLPNDRPSLELVQSCLASLDIRFSDAVCRVDTANANAGRIWKLYGTMTHKGDSTPLRPHRRSALLKVPDQITVVSRDLLTRLGTFYPPVPPEPTESERSKGTIDLASWLHQHLPGFREKPYRDAALYLLDTCPFSTAHTDGAYAIQFANGAIFAGCHHDSCGGGTQRWQELRDRFETRTLQKPRASPEVISSSQVPETGDTHTPAPFRPVHPSPDTAFAETGDPRITALAETILQEQSPLRYMLDTFGRDHEGDQVVAECLLMSLASRPVLNSKGLHVSITGESGKGKSHAIDTLLRQVPKEFRLEGRMSEKALFYISGMEPGTVITLDDHALSDQLQEILKGVTTAFHRPFIYHTVSKDRTGQICTIPPRCVWWVAKVEGSGDDQVFNRMLTCWIDDSEDLDHRVLERTLNEASLPPVSSLSEREEHQVCQEIWNQLEPVFVIIQYASRIQFVSAANRRNPDMLLDLIRSHAALHQYQREVRTEQGIRCIIATTDDFMAAAGLYSALNNNCGGQITKLTRHEATLLSYIRDMNISEFTVPDLQKATGNSNSVINKLLNGYISRGQIYSGLLQKCPAISYLDRSISSGAGGYTTHRRNRAYTWDPEIYASWDVGGEVWLMPEEKPDTDLPGSGPSGDPMGHDSDQPDTRRSYPSCGAAEKPGMLRHAADLPRSINPNEMTPNNKIINNIVHPSYAAEECPHEAHSRTLSSPPSSLTEISRSAASPNGDRNEGQIHDPDSFVAAATPAALPQMPRLPQVPQVPHSPVHPPIDPDDFIAVEGWPEKKPCIICGRQYSHYQERMTHTRLKEPHRENRMLCAGCYEAARVRIAMTVRTIPGLIDTDPMEHRNTPTGKCSICHTGSAVWIDPGQQIAICETCYQREKGLQKGSNA